MLAKLLVKLHLIIFIWFQQMLPILRRLDSLTEECGDTEILWSRTTFNFDSICDIVRDMRQLERRLGEEGFRLKVFSFISGIGGTVASVVGRILRRLMTYSLGSLFCYKRLNGDKYAFQKTNICSIIIGKQ